MEKARSTELPDVIIQHIQSFLNPNEAAQTILVSKSWLRAWSTHPFLHFDFFDVARLKGKYLNDSIDIVDRTLKSYVERGILILRFHLYIKTIQERWLKIICQSNVIELDLAGECDWTASLFREIFRKKSLQVLRLNLQVFPLVILRYTDDIKCLDLKKVELCWMKISEVTFFHIMSSCPLIEELRLENCGFVDFLRTYNLGIQSLMFASEYIRLKRLSLVDTEINDEQLQTLLSKSPHLEDLNIIGCSKLVNPVNLSSVTLKRVVFDRSLVRACLIHVPNLQKLKFGSCRYRTNPFPITITRRITKGTVKVNIVYYDIEIDESWFHRLREFLTKFLKSNVKFIPHFDEPLTSNFKVLRATPLPPLHEVETFRFKGYKDLPLLYAFFSICHPKNVLFDRLDTIPNRRLVLKLLNDTEDLSYPRNLECCNSYQKKCWRHYIKDAKLYYEADEAKKPLDINGLKTGLGKEEEVTLVLKWKSSKSSY